MMPTMPYSSASPTRKTRLKSRRRNRRQGQTRCHWLAQSHRFIFKTEQWGEGAERLFFRHLALAGTSTRMVGWKKLPPRSSLYRRKPHAHLSPAHRQYALHFCYRFFIDQRPDGDAFLQPSPMCNLLTACCNFSAKRSYSRPARINGWRRRRFARRCGIRGQRTFHGFVEVGIVKDDKRALPPSSSDTFLMSFAHCSITGGQFRSNR